MSSRFLSLVTDEVRTNEVIFATSCGEKLGTVIVENNKFIFDPPIVLGAEEEVRVGVTGNFSTPEGVTSNQSTNVVSYNPETKTTTFRELGLYNDSVPMLTKTGSEVDDYRIVSNYSIVPKIHGIDTSEQGYSLGNENAYWKSIYAKDVFTTNGTIHVLNPKNNQQMSIQYNPEDLSATLSNNSYTVKAVSTSINIPGQIDPDLLPFAGLSFGGTFKAKNFVETIGNVFDVHTRKMAYTLILDIISEYSTYSSPPNTTTNALFRMLNGSYYVVNGIGDGYTQNMVFSKLVAETNLTSYNREDAGIITSNFEAQDAEIFTLSDNQLIILSVGLEANVHSPGKINISMRWNLVNFKVPINGVTTFNIVDNAITNPKLATNSVSTVNIRSKSVTADKIADDAVSLYNIKNGAVSFNKLTSDVQGLLLKPTTSSGDEGGVSQQVFDMLLREVQRNRLEIDTLQEQIKLTNSRWENRVYAIEEYIAGMLKTYVLQKNAVIYKYTGNYTSNLVNLLNLEIIGKVNNDTLIISVDPYTYNVLYTDVKLYDINGETIATLTKNDFNSSSLKTSIKLNEKYLNDRYFPLSLEVLSLAGDVVESVNLTFNSYENLPNI